MHNFQKTYERKLSYLTINHHPYQEFIGPLTKFWIITWFHVHNKKSKFIQNFKTSFRSSRLGIFFIKKNLEVRMYVTNDYPISTRVTRKFEFSQIYIHNRTYIYRMKFPINKKTLIHSTHPGMTVSEESFIISRVE